MNTLVFTFDKTLNEKTKPAKYRQLLRFYTQALKRGQALGYNVEMYTNSDKFDNIADKVHWVDKDFHKYEFWDSFKFVPLKERTDDYLLCDGDILFHERINIDKVSDVLFDAWEIANWSLVYSEDINKLTELGIKKVIPEWVNLRQHVMNCGILKFNDQELKNTYIDRWDKFHSFCIEHRDELNLKKCTAIGAQYLLTILCNYFNSTRSNYSTTLRQANPFYVHYAGTAKFQGDITAMKEVSKI